MFRSFDGRVSIFNCGSKTERNKDIPKVLLAVADVWYSFSERVGDKGSCVVGAKLNFKYKDEEYKMYPQSPYQGEMSWTKNIDYVISLLEDAGAEEIMWHYGSLD